MAILCLHCLAIPHSKLIELKKHKSLRTGPYHREIGMAAIPKNNDPVS